VEARRRDQRRELLDEFLRALRNGGTVHVAATRR
jgi:hypothetical protein